MDKDYELTAALRAAPNYISERIPADLIAPYLDHYNDMTYDYNAAYNQYAALNGPLGSCANPEWWESHEDQDCETTDFGDYDSNGNFVAGQWTDCWGLCNGENYGQASSDGLKY
jgi:GH18 family chitinase